MEPGSHGTQAVALGEDWYVPPSQGMHSDARKSELIEPGVHGVGVTEPVEQALPGGHDEHCDWSARSEALLWESRAPIWGTVPQARPAAAPLLARYFRGRRLDVGPPHPTWGMVVGLTLAPKGTACQKAEVEKSRRGFR